MENRSNCHWVMSCFHGNNPFEGGLVESDCGALISHEKLTTILVSFSSGIDFLCELFSYVVFSAAGLVGFAKLSWKAPFSYFFRQLFRKQPLTSVNSHHGYLALVSTTCSRNCFTADHDLQNPAVFVPNVLLSEDQLNR